MLHLSVVLFLFGVTLSTGALHAQNRVGRPGLTDPSQANPLLQMQQGFLESSMENAMMALEGALDPEEYLVGPGDQFSIVTGGMEPIRVVVPVSADGNLLLPEAGSVDAGGRTLAEVEAEAMAALRSHFRNVPLEVSLVQPRLFYVHISGSIPEPGRYLMLPIARVDDALQQAYASRVLAKPDPQADNAPRILTSATSERPALNQTFRPSLRNVVLTRSDSTTRSLDLMRYYVTGDTDQNPYLHDGDVIEVPAYNVERDAVRVTGEVAFPGIFDHRPGDTVLDLLTLAAGPNGLENLPNVRLAHRTTEGRTETRDIDVQAIRDGEAPPVPVAPGDVITVVPKENAQASIQGLVNFPGTFPIENGETTLRELVAMAGGLKPEANPRAAFIERRQSLAFKTTSRANNLDFFDRVYLQRSLSENRVVLDIEQALEPGSEEVVLYSGDRVVFPRDEGTVFVTGNVPQPGYVPFASGRDASYYVQEAGGKGPLSTAVIIFEAGTGQMKQGEDVVVRPGDTVFVNRKNIAEDPEVAALLISDKNARRQSRISTTQTIITGVSAITSIITAYVALRSIGN